MVMAAVCSNPSTRMPFPVLPPRPNGPISESSPRSRAQARAAAKSPEAQGSLESSVEAFTALLQSDARARDYTKAGQLLSAGDVTVCIDVVKLLSCPEMVIDRKKIVDLTANDAEDIDFDLGKLELLPTTTIHTGTTTGAGLNLGASSRNAEDRASGARSGLAVEPGVATRPAEGREQ